MNAIVANAGRVNDGMFQNNTESKCIRLFSDKTCRTGYNINNDSGFVCEKYLLSGKTTSYGKVEENTGESSPESD